MPLPVTIKEKRCKSMNTFLIIIIVILSSIGMAALINFLINTTFNATEAKKDHRKKHIDDLDMIVKKLDEIIRILQNR